MVMAWYAAHVGVLTVSVASAAAAVVVAAVVALARAIVAAFVLGCVLPGASNVNFALDTPRNGPEQTNSILLLDNILTAHFYVIHLRAGLEHCGDDIAEHLLRGKLRGVLRQINHT